MHTGSNSKMISSAPIHLKREYALLKNAAAVCCYCQTEYVRKQNKTKFNG